MNTKITIEEIFRHKEQLKFDVIQAIEKYKVHTGLTPTVETLVESVSIADCALEFANYEVKITQHL
jgi:hypothetical protein